jgi:peptidoglycan/LPS O-acetylase OafA/YrhL
MRGRRLDVTATVVYRWFGPLDGSVHNREREPEASRMRPPTSLAYRPDIDGLRAVAVLSVVVYHAFPGRFDGGFVGVDVFFVISGFLISGIITSGLRDGTFSFRTFYARRVRRIFPALVVVLTCSVAAGWFLLLPGEYKQLGEHVAAGAGFVSNLVLWREAGYFDTAAEQKVLLHLWSLGVEEQFYLVWPLFLYAAARLRWRASALTGAVLVASFAANVLQVRHDPVAAFYSPVTRFWELMVGALLAWGTEPRPQSVSRSFASPPLGSILSFAGVGMIGLALALVRQERMFPGFWALLPVLGAALVIAAGPTSWTNRHVLSWRPAVFVGRISYPLYVWHWPLLVFLAEYGSYSGSSRLLTVAVAFCLAWGTAHFVEGPIRTGATRTAKVAAPAIAMTALFLVGLGIYELNGFPWRFPGAADYVAYFDNSQPEYRYIHEHGLAQAYRFDCDFGNPSEQWRTALDPSCYTPHAAKSVFLWGDSHAQQYYSGLREELPSDVSLLIVATSGCPPSIDRSSKDVCNHSNAFAREKIALVHPDVVILAQLDQHEQNNLAATASWLRQSGTKHVVLMGPVPEWRPTLNAVIARHYWPDPPDRVGGSHLNPKMLKTNGALHAMFDGSPLVTLVSPIDALCNERGCLAYVNDDRREGLMTWDYGHLTKAASIFVARTIVAPVINRLLQEP